jgi:hypothetical protein
MASDPSDASNGSSLALSSSHTEPAAPGIASSSFQLAISDSSMEVTLHHRVPTPGPGGVPQVGRYLHKQNKSHLLGVVRLRAFVQTV